MEIVKSEVITVASCSLPNKPKPKERNKKTRKAVRFHGHEKWSPVSEASATSARFHSPGNKIWRFKHISFPWNPKPAKRATSDDSRGQKQSKISSQGDAPRVIRTHSAPKSLGAQFRGRKMESKGITPSDIDNNKKVTHEVEIATEDANYHRLSPPVLDPWRRRRISLPNFATDAMALRETAAMGDSLREQCCLTPNSHRKKFLPPQLKITAENQDEEDVLRTKSEKNNKANEIRKSSADAAVNKTNEMVETKPRSHSFDLPNVHALSLNEKSNNFIPFAKLSSQKTGQDAQQTTNTHKPSRKHLQVKKVTSPDIFFVPIPGDEIADSNNDEEDDEDEERLSNSEPTLQQLYHPEICQPAEPMPLNITIQEIIRTELQVRLEKREFCVEMCQEWCKEISQTIKRQVQELRSESYKVACVVYIGALRGHGVHASVQSLWSPLRDNFTAVSYKNNSLFAIASVLAMKFEQLIWVC